MKVGDTVVRTTGYFNESKILGEVIRLTPSGRIVIKSKASSKEETFNADGSSRGNSVSYYKPKIKVATPGDIEKITKSKLLEEIKVFCNIKVNVNDMTLDGLQLMKEVIDTWQKQQEENQFNI